MRVISVILRYSSSLNALLLLLLALSLPISACKQNKTHKNAPDLSAEERLNNEQQNSADGLNNKQKSIEDNGVDESTSHKRFNEDHQRQADAGILREVKSARLGTRPERIVSIAPNLTEIIYLLGADERLVGVTRYDDYPPQVKNKARVGGLIDVDLEALLTLRPDLVVGTSQGSDADFVAKLDRAGIPYYFIQMNTLEEIYAGIERLGELLGEAARGAKISQEMRAEIEEIAAKSAPDNPAKDTPDGARPSVLLVFGHDPLVVAGPGSFGDELLTIAGAKNALGEAKSPYPVLDIEKILSLNPAYIIDTTLASGAQGARVADPNFWAAYNSLDAVKSGQVTYFEDADLLRPAPRLVQGLQKLHAVIGAK